ERRARRGVDGGPRVAAQLVDALLVDDLEGRTVGGGEAARTGDLERVVPGEPEAPDTLCPPYLPTPPLGWTRDRHRACQYSRLQWVAERRYEGRMRSLVCLAALAACSSSTVIRSNPPGARVFVDGQYVGQTPVVMSDTKIVGSTTSVRL